MKKYRLPLVIFLISVAVFIIFFGSDNNTKKTGTEVFERRKIIIDAGHGGVDGGAVSANGIVEKNINLSISLKLKKLFELSGFSVIMTRETDISIHDNTAGSIRAQKTSDLHNRLKIADENQDALLLSIHQNKFSSKSSHGMHVFYSGNNPQSKYLADSIQSFNKENLDKQNERQTKKITKDVYLIYNAKQPAVLVECGFLSNPEEAEKLTQNSYQQELAFCIYGAVIEYCD